MFVAGAVYEFDLVWQMQFSDDLQNMWMMFNHVKRVQGWMTMACHMYDLIYCKVMTIMICDMQFEDMEAQCILWRKLNIVAKKKRLGMPFFKGFMVDNAQVN
jgi:6-phosphofructokinase